MAHVGNADSLVPPPPRSFPRLDEVTAEKDSVAGSGKARRWVKRRAALKSKKTDVEPRASYEAAPVADSTDAANQLCLTTVPGNSKMDAAVESTVVGVDSAVAPKGGAGCGRGGNNTSVSLMAGPYMSGLRIAYDHRYRSDIERLYSRSDMQSTARWFDSHTHLESILARTWRGGGKPQVTDHEPNHDLVNHVKSWPEGLDGCICNCVFSRPSKPGFPPEWAWLQTNLPHFENGPASSKLWFTIGLHPHDARNWNADAENLVRRWANHPKCVGIGECGLDFFRHERGEAEVQVRAFKAQVSLAVELNKALVVHARLVTKENEALFLSVLLEVVPEDHPIHMHCYGDSLELAVELCRRWPRLRVGFTGAITFRDPPQTKRGKGKGQGQVSSVGVKEKKGEEHCRELVTGLPTERLLLETDGPYMCAEPFRGQTAHPGHVHRVAERIAAWQGEPLTHVLAATRSSTKVVYGV
eukprot:TRINITY_DN30964_c0_g1_i1.p1 TRINITY_DN30964_c0_g1~~TRINITY_DN30964_c0_g1_i1.p1  ORF type:complete len:486 (-),score=71.99 TRINITY_DN30964_c0_g1_i1:28-1437(-)